MLPRAEDVLHEPLLYLSLCLKKHRSEYYDLLQRIRFEGDWERWLAFFATGVRETAEHAVATARKLARLFDSDRARIVELGRVAGSALRVHEQLQRHPVLPIPIAARRTHLSPPTVTTALGALERIGVVRELTGRRRDRRFGYDAYLKILDEGLDPASSASSKEDSV